jgi:hypothetical protein
MSSRPLASARACLLVAVLARAGLGAPAGAAPIAFTGELTIDLGALGQYATAGSGVADVAPTGAFALPGGAFAISEIQPLPFSLLGITAQLEVVGANAPGSFEPGGGPDGGFGAEFAPFAGSAFLGVDLGTFPVTLTALPLVLLGNGGTFTFPPGPFDLSTVTGAWTTGVSTRVYTDGGATLTLTVSGFDARTAGGLGPLQLVTPVTIFDVADAVIVPGFATLALTFVPEPAGLLLLVVGLVTLAVALRLGP